MSNILPQQNTLNPDVTYKGESLSEEERTEAIKRFSNEPKPKREYKKRTPLTQIQRQRAVEKQARVDAKRADFARLTRRRDLRADAE